MSISSRESFSGSENSDIENSDMSMASDDEGYVSESTEESFDHDDGLVGELPDLPNELWVVIADQYPDLYYTMVRLSRLHRDILNQTWQARVSGDLTETPLLRPSESFRDFYHRTSHKLKRPLLSSGEIKPVSIDEIPTFELMMTAVGLGLEKYVDRSLKNIKPTEYPERKLLKKLVKQLSVSGNTRLTTILLNFAKLAQPNADDQARFFLACATKYFDEKPARDRHSSDALSLLINEIPEATLNRLDLNFVFKNEWMIEDLTVMRLSVAYINALCVRLTDIRHVLSRLTPESQIDLIENTISYYFILTFLSRNDLSKENMAHALSTLVNSLPTNKRNDLINLLGTVAIFMIIGDLDSIRALTNIPLLIKLIFKDRTLETSSDAERAKHRRNLLGIINFLSVLIASDEELNQLILLDNGNQIKTLKRCVVLAAAVELPPAKIRFFLSRLSKDIQIHLIKKLILRALEGKNASRFHHISYLIEIAKEQDCLLDVLKSLLLIDSKKENYPHYASTHQKRINKLQKYFPMLPWLTLIEEEFLNALELKGIDLKLFLSVFHKNIHMNQILFSHLSRLTKEENEELLRRIFKSFSDGDYHSVLINYLNELIPNKNKSSLFILFSETYGNKLEKLFISLCIHEAKGKTRIARPLFRFFDFNNDSCTNMLLDITEKDQDINEGAHVLWRCINEEKKLTVLKTLILAAYNDQYSHTNKHRINLTCGLMNTLSDDQIEDIMLDRLLLIVKKQGSIESLLWVFKTMPTLSRFNILDLYTTILVNMLLPVWKVDEVKHLLSFIHQKNTGDTARIIKNSMRYAIENHYDDMLVALRNLPLSWSLLSSADINSILNELCIETLSKPNKKQSGTPETSISAPSIAQHHATLWELPDSPIDQPISNNTHTTSPS